MKKIIHTSINEFKSNLIKEDKSEDLIEQIENTLKSVLPKEVKYKV